MPAAARAKRRASKASTSGGGPPRESKTMDSAVNFESTDDIALADRMKAGRRQIIEELGKRIIGQADVIELVLLTLFVGGNSLIRGVPGVAKTLLIATPAQVLELNIT